VTREPENQQLWHPAGGRELQWRRVAQCHDVRRAAHEAVRRVGL